MKTKDIKSYRGENSETLLKKVNDLRGEITKLTLEQKTNPPKDSNLLAKKRKQLSIVLTILQEQKLYGKTA
jgi:ribosomal protein L29